MNIKTHNNKSLSFIETFTRKARTLFSIIHSGVVVWEDGIDPRSMTHYERLRYLEFQPFLNFKEGMVVYDVGANLGEMASFFARFPSVSRVYCFEPVKKVFLDLVKRSKNYEKIKCFQIALGDKSGSERMYVNEFSPSSSILPLGPIHIEEFPVTKDAHEEEIRMMTLEEIVHEYSLFPPDFIKIDVQGFEDRVIRGGKDIVKKARFCMLELSLVSLYEESVLITDINSLMRSIGFHLVGIVGKIVGKSGEILQVDGLYRNDRIES